PRQSVRLSSSTSAQTALSRRVPRDHSGTPRAISTPMPLRGMRCRLPSGPSPHSLATLYYGLARAIDARAPPADPAAGRQQHRRMSSVNLPQASAGAALFGRAVVGPLDDASRLVPPIGTFPGRASRPYVDNAT